MVGGLDEPNSFAFLPDGRVLLTEQRTGNVRMVVNGAIAATDPLLTVPDLNDVGYERGLQGIAVDPAWPARPFVYLFHSRTGGFHRLVRYTASGDLGDPDSGILTLVTPRLLIDDIPDETPNHNAGGLRFGPDGRLYLSLGEDDAFLCDAADRTSLRGQILRLKVDTIPAGGGPQVPRADLNPGDNPWAAAADANEKLVFAYGMRNPWRYQIDPVSGFLYGCDAGEADFEEVNEIRPGDFLGWPWREANLSILRAECPEPGGQGAMPYAPPIASFARDAEMHAVTSAGMYRPAPGGVHNWPSAYYPDRGDVFYTDYYVGDLKRITWNGSAWLPAPPVPGQPTGSAWASGLLTAVDFLVGPDGSLWWMSQFNEFFDPASGSVQRIRYTGVTGVGGGPPMPAAFLVRPNPSRGAAELVFSLARAGHARVTIVDLQGRRVRRLLDQPLPAGERRLVWDGSGDAGERLPAGVYLARLERDGAPDVTRRVLRLS